MEDGNEEDDDVAVQSICSKSKAETRTTVKNVQEQMGREKKKSLPMSNWGVGSKVAAGKAIGLPGSPLCPCLCEVSVVSGESACLACLGSVLFLAWLSDWCLSKVGPCVQCISYFIQKDYTTHLDRSFLPFAHHATREEGS